MKRKVNNAFLLVFLLFVSLGSAWSQTSTIRGTIKDAEGKPINLAQAILEGKQKGATTNESGNYEIKGIEAGSYTLVFKASGFETIKQPLTIVAGKDQVIDISMKAGAEEIEELTVIGYGSTRTKDITGAATVISE
jgi:hypothetical protein